MEKRFYYQAISDGVDRDQTQLSTIGFKEEDTFVDISVQNEMWSLLTSKAKKGDEIFISSIDQLARNSDDLLMKVHWCEENGVFLKMLSGHEINPEISIAIIDFVNTTNRKRYYEKQMAGIRKALVEKEQGLRTYGRPSIEIPSDFKENLKRIANKELTHDEYRKQIGMKKSTYFAKVKEFKD